MTLLGWSDHDPQSVRFDHKEFDQHRVAFWNPKDRLSTTLWIDRLMQHVREEPNQELYPSLQRFEGVVDRDPDLKRLAAAMLDEVPRQEDPYGRPVFRSFHEVLQAINRILTEGPPWDQTQYDVGYVGSPINMILDLPMGTPSGRAFLSAPAVNACFAEVLATWARYLSSADSARVLAPPHGWLGARGLRALTATGNANGFGAAGTASFAQLYPCPDPGDAATLGFASWDAFFTRAFRAGARPVAAPADDAVVVHACEAAPHQHPVAGVRRTDRFFAKGQPYSLAHMLAAAPSDPLVDRFVGGTVYQAFLSALSYHRWHAPVAGSARSALVRPEGASYFPGLPPSPS